MSMSQLDPKMSNMQTFLLGCPSTSWHCNSCCGRRTSFCGSESFFNNFRSMGYTRTLATDSSEFSLQSCPTCEAETTFKKTDSPCVDNSTSTRLATCALSDSSHAQIPRSRMLECSQSEGQDSDNAVSGSEWEDERKESENVEYNVAELTEPCQRIVIALGGMAA